MLSEGEERARQDMLAYIGRLEARVAELEKLLLEARTFMEDDFPPIPASQLTFEQCCVTPRYFEFWKALHKTLSL